MPKAEPQAMPAVPATPRPPQGIEFRYRDPGKWKKYAMHPRWKMQLIDPDCLQPNGEDPYLMLPYAAPDGTRQFRIRQILALHASVMLTCNEENGFAPQCRLATDEEVAAYKAELAQRREACLAEARNENSKYRRS